MKSRWCDSEARQALDRWGAAWGEAFALRVYTGRLIGSDSDLVLHGGGNVSIKTRRRDALGRDVEVVCVKASGRDLGRIEPEDLPAVEMGPLLGLCDMAELTDDELANQFRRAMLDTSAPAASIETLMHAVLPERFVDHSHPDALLALTNQPNGQEVIHEVLGDRVRVVPYVSSGLPLARAVREAIAGGSGIDGIVLSHHGLVTFADDSRTAYERHIELVAACREYIMRRTAQRRVAVRFACSEDPKTLLVKGAPVLRRVLSVQTGDEDRPWRRPILEAHTSGVVRELVDSEPAERLATSGPITTDHLIRTKPWPMYVGEPRWEDQAELAEQIAAATERYEQQYRDYVGRHGGDPASVDAKPRIVLLPGVGLVASGACKADAVVSADIAEHALRVQFECDAMGGYQPLAEEHLFDMEHRFLQQAKVAPDARRPLEGQVVAISGGAGAIGSAVAECCAAAGAHVAVFDIDDAGAAAVADRVEKRHGRGRCVGLPMDVTDEASVANGFDSLCRIFGGVDVVVPNAGIAHVSSIEELSLEDFRRVMRINVDGYLLFLREGTRLLKRQGLGGNVVIVSSKNVFGPGKDFGAYSASKAAGHQLGRVAAIELAGDGIRVNMINADAIFGEAERPSGLWAEVGPQRAASRGMSTAELPDYYRSRNLLKARVTGRHVGNAVVFFASNATPTTGAALPVDGGVVEAFPR